MGCLAPACTPLDGAAAPTRQPHRLAANRLPATLPAPMALPRCAGPDEVVRTHPFAPYGRARPGETLVRTALSTPTGVRDLAGQGPGPGSRRGRPPVMIRWYVDNRRSHGGRRPQRNPCQLAGEAGRAAGPGRRPVRPGGAETARPGVGARAAGRPAPQELLDDRRARRPGRPRRPAAPAGRRGLGPRQGPRRRPRLAAGAPG